MCCTPSAGSRVSASETAPTPPARIFGELPPPLSVQFTRPPQLQRASRLQDRLRRPVPLPTPGPDSFRPRLHMLGRASYSPSVDSLPSPVPRSAAVPSSGKPVVVEEGEPRSPNNCLLLPTSPTTQKWLWENADALCRRPLGPSSESRVTMCEHLQGRLCAHLRPLGKLVEAGN